MKKLKITRLEIIVFACGAILMILELIGSRIFAPYLGTSIFVWSSIIGIILGALSLGYYLGGRLSKDNPRLSFLGFTLLLASFLVFFLNIIREPILVFSMAMGVKIGSVFATIILFAPSSIILGIISPYALRLKIKSVESSGITAGNLYAISTIGSIFGTFLAGFYLIPNFSSTQIILGLCFALIILAATALKNIKIKLLFISLIVFIYPFSLFFNKPKFLFEADTSYNHIVVKDFYNDELKKNLRIMYLGTEAQSIIFTDSDEIFSPYIKVYRLDNLFGKNFKKALALGGGGYVKPIDFLKQYPNSEITVLEIDPKVTEAAKNFFNLKEDKRLKIIHEDARIFLNRNREKFDIIYGDAFASFFAIPFQLTTIESMQKIYDSLNENGVFAINIISSLNGEKSLFFKAEYKTISQYFPQIYVFPCENNPNEIQNIILFAVKSKERLTMQDLQKNASEEQKKLLKYYLEKEIAVDEKTPILTDDFAPVDYYISKFL